MDTNALFKISYGLFVLSSCDNGKQNGCIINTAMQITAAQPFLMTISVNKGNFTTAQLLSSRKFNLSILSETAQFEQFKHFGFQSGKDVNKFADINYSIAANGVAYITDNVSAYISCDVLDVYDFDTHYLIKSIVTDMAILSPTPPTTYSYYHANIKPKPQATSGYICTICGYKYDGAILPADIICPLCKHGAADFVKA